MSAGHAVTLRLSLDAAPAVAAFDEISALVQAAVGRADCPAELGDLLGDLVREGAGLVAIEMDGGATADTDHLVMVIEPSDGLRRLLEALRAGDLDRLLVEHRSNPFVGGVA